MSKYLSLLLCLGPMLAPTYARAAAPVLRDLVVSPNPVELGPGEEIDLVVVGVYDDGSTADLSGQVLVQSGDERVVIASGRTVIAVGEGETELRVEHPATGVRADDSPRVTVFEIDELLIEPASATVEVGSTVRLRALAVLTSGRAGFDASAVVDWESSDADVASVETGTVAGLAVGETEIRVRDRASGARSNEPAVVTVTPKPDPNARLLEVVAEPVDSRALAGDVIQLVVSGFYDDETVRDITDDVTYESNRPLVADVDEQGRVYALAPGTATIRIDHPSGRSVADRPEVWVGDLQAIHLDPIGAELLVGTTQAISALATYDNGRGADLTEDVDWASDLPGVAAVSNVVGTRGLVSAVSPGTAHVTAQDGSTGIRSPASEGVIVVAAPTPSPTATPGPTTSSSSVRDLVVEPALLRLRPGESATLQVTAVHRDGGMTDVTDRARFRVRDRTVATVESPGVVTGRRGGRTEVRVRDPESGRRARGSVRIDVTQPMRLRVSPETVELGVGEQKALVALADFDDGRTEVDVTQEVVWSLEEGEGVLAVGDGGSKGEVTGLSDGRARVRVTDPTSGTSSDGSTGRVAVGAAPDEDPGELVALRFEPDPLVLPLHTSGFVTVSGVLADGSTIPLDPADLHFHSSSPRVVRVSAHGEIRARRSGVAPVDAVHAPSGVAGRFPVVARAIVGLTVEPASSVVAVGQSVDLVALAEYGDGSGLWDRTRDVRWRSLDPGLLALDPDVPGRAIGRAEGIAIVEVTDPESKTRSSARTGVVHVVTGLVRLSARPSGSALAAGETRSLQALAHYSDGSVVDVSNDVDWSAADPLVASVAAGGQVTAGTVGDTWIAATDPVTGIASMGLDRAFVAVGREVVGLQVSTGTALEEEPRRRSLAAGQTARLHALALLDGGGPTDRSDRVTWISSNPTAVGVTQEGLATCNRMGTATIRVEDTSIPLTSTETLGDASVACSPATVVRLDVRPAESNVDYPDSRNLRAFRVFTDGHEVEVTGSVRWISADPETLAVVKSGTDGGRVTGLNDGIVTVTAMDDAFGERGTAVVTVRKVRVDLRIFESDPPADGDGVFRGHVGDILKLRARVEYASGVTQGVNQVVEWSSSNPSIVRMGAAANLANENWGRMLAVGTTTITARWPADAFSPELTDSVRVEVVP